MPGPLSRPHFVSLTPNPSGAPSSGPREPGASRPGLAYRPAVDGLRAVAILGVVAYHINLPGITGGYCGVDVFFVISGYLITQLLLAELQRTGRISIVQFYARRARRLLPALAIVIFVTLLLGLGLIPPGSARKQLGDSAIASVLFVAN
jgi:peptidoglycan/LPS O-acetylase OafA/YrhL